jgi:CRISPR/Cas system-associated protein Cas10 (large subunit of type III CRISPR-Cas system)
MALRYPTLDDVWQIARRPAESTEGQRQNLRVALHELEALTHEAQRVASIFNGRLSRLEDKPTADSPEGPGKTLTD